MYKSRLRNVIMVLAGSLLFILSGIPALAQEEMSGAETGEGDVYTIKKGDTLWDLSDEFYNDPTEWPQLWEINRERTPIENPHLIYPGQRILITPSPGAKPSPVPTAETKAPSMPDQTSGMAVSPDEAPATTGEEGKETEKPHFFYSLINRAGFVTENLPYFLGEIFKVQGNKQMISTNDIIYIRNDEPEQMVVGREYSIIRAIKKLQHPKTRETIGFQNQMKGIVELTEKHDGFSMGRITKAYRTIRLGDKIIPHKKRSRNIPYLQSTPGIRGILIGFEENKSIIAEDYVGFIDKGANDGIYAGQKYDIYRRERASSYPGKAKDTLLPPVIYGSLLVITTEPESATVIILNSTERVEIGARFKTPEVAKTARPASQAQAQE
jgi:hypothetical protein